MVECQARTLWPSVTSAWQVQSHWATLFRRLVAMAYRLSADRQRKPAWDRKLSENEWEYYVGRYSEEMKLRHDAVDRVVRQHSELPNENTRQVAQRWKDMVVPKLQTDMEHNLDAIKAAAAKGRQPEPVSLNEYRLFAVPDHNALSEDALTALRGREVERLENWWRSRRQQLKPPK